MNQVHLMITSCSYLNRFLHSDGKIQELAPFSSSNSIPEPLVTTRPIPYLYQTSSVLRKSPLELLSVLLE